MLLQYDGRKYEILLASSIGYGMGVELWDVTQQPDQQVLLAFQFDGDDRVEFDCFMESVPFELVEIFVKVVREWLLTNYGTQAQSDEETGR